MRGKLIVIEGTDCSGKETQSNKLYEYLIFPALVFEMTIFDLFPLSNFCTCVELGFSCPYRCGPHTL